MYTPHHRKRLSGTTYTTSLRPFNCKHTRRMPATTALLLLVVLLPLAITAEQGGTCKSATLSSCVDGMRLVSCETPMVDAVCIPCEEYYANEALYGGYSFGAYVANSEKYELMQRRGSFEYSDLDRQKNSFTVVNTFASDNVDDKAALVAWKEVLFPTKVSPNPTWFGTGKIDIHFRDGVGASNSNVYLEMSAPYTKIAICGIPIGNRDQKRTHQKGFTVNNHRRGVIYEFQYRQRVTFADSITVKSVLSDTISPEQSHLGSQLYILPSKESWTRVQRLFDYTDMCFNDVCATDINKPRFWLPDTTCLQLEFNMAKGHEVLLDDVRVFANLIANSMFKTQESWSGFELIDVDLEYVVLTSYARLATPIRLHVLDSKTSDPVLSPITMSIDVRGNGHLVVSCDGVVVIWKHIKTSPADSLNDPSWQTFTITVNVVTTRSHHILEIEKQEVIGDNADTYLHVDNVFAYVDDRRCPVVTLDVNSATSVITRCNDPETHLFVNGRCERCSSDDLIGTDEEFCPDDRKQTSCQMKKEGVSRTCSDCDAVGTYPPSKDDDGDTTMGAFINHQNGKHLECTFKCEGDFWYSRGTGTPGGSGGGPLCIKCTPLSELRCRAGWYAAKCGLESDAVCKPCDLLDRYDTSVVYTGAAADYTMNMYEESAIAQCKHACSPGLFQYGVHAHTGIPLCFPCSTSVCGAKDEGLSTLRLLDGMQYTSKCTASQDSRCRHCKSDDAAVLFTENGNAMDDWCAYDCAPGSRRCGTCLWEPSKAVVLLTAPTLDLQPPPSTGYIPIHPTLMVRLTGIATIYTAQFDTQLSIKVYVVAKTGSGQHADLVGEPWHPPSEVGYVLRLFPIVPPAALTAMKKAENVSTITDAPPQPFDVTVEVRDFINTYSFRLWKHTTTTSDTGVLLFLAYDIVAGGVTDGSGVSTEATMEDMSLVDFSVSAFNSTSGCCASRVDGTTTETDTEAETIDASIIRQQLRRCTACTEAAGIAAPLPDNAHWEGSNDCEWMCDQHYELTSHANTHSTASVSCEACNEPKCNLGRYWEACGTCKDCDSAPLNTKFTGPGTTRYDNMSCPFQCIDGFYHDREKNICVTCIPSNELNCASRTDGAFFEIACGQFEDTTCVNCRICPVGFNASTPCGRYNDATCSVCNQSRLRMPSLTESGGAVWRLGTNSDDYCAWSCATGLLYDPVANICVDCTHPCGVGYFRTECAQDNAFTGCAPCSRPVGAVMLSTGLPFMNHSCLWECPEDTEYTATLNRCTPQTIDVPPSINVPVPLTDIPCTRVSAAQVGVCDWGFSVDTSLMYASSTSPPCKQMCAACPIVSFTQRLQRVYKHKGSCAWECKHPYLRMGNTCVSMDHMV